MPNHVITRISTDEQTLQDVIELVVCEDEEEGIHKGTDCFDFAKIIPMPKDIFTGALGDKERKIYGDRNWYDWNCANWGTKWNSYDYELREDNSIQFQTAWSHPFPIIHELSRVFSEATFYIQYADEDIGNNCGEYSIRNGVISNKENENSREFAMSLWVYSDEDFEEENEEEDSKNRTDARCGELTNKGE